MAPNKANANAATAKQLTAMNNKLNALSVRVANPPKPLGTKTKGGKRRATRALLGKAADALSLAEIDAFWSARCHMTPPALRTTFGNYCCLNSVDRVSLNTSTVNFVNIVFAWSPSAISYILWESNALTNISVAKGCFTQLQQPGVSLGNTSSILSLRPLRMSCTISSLGSATTTNGNMRVNSFDGPLPFGTVTWPIPYNGNFFISNAQPFNTAMSDGLDTHEVPLMSLFEPLEFVSVPSSYTAYNSYQEFIPLIDSNDTTNLLAGDAANLFANEKDLAYPYSAGGIIPFPSNWIAGVPPMRTMAFQIPPTSPSVPIRMEFHRQDGVRFNPNSLGASFNHTPVKMTAAGEDKHMSSIQGKSVLASVPTPAKVVSAAAAKGSSLVPRAKPGDIMSLDQSAFNSSVLSTLTSFGSAASNIYNDYSRFSSMGFPMGGTVRERRGGRK